MRVIRSVMAILGDALLKDFGRSLRAADRLLRAHVIPNGSYDLSIR